MVVRFHCQLKKLRSHLLATRIGVQLHKPCLQKIARYVKASLSYPQQFNLQSSPQSRRIRKYWVRPIFKTHESHGDWFTLIPQMRAQDPDRFFNYFRHTIEEFDELLKIVGPFIEKKTTFFRKPICPGERLAICLRYYASGNSFMSLSYQFRVSDQTISKIVLETSAVIWSVLKPQVFEPRTEEMWLRVAAEYEVMWDLLHCCGATDGKLFYFKKPPHSGSRYHSYKKRYSFILLAVVDAKRKFIIVDVGSSGRRGDGNVFHNSRFGKKLQKGGLNLPPACQHEKIPGYKVPFFFVADGAFELNKHIVKPFKTVGGYCSKPHRLFNYRVSRGRHTVEDAFGLLVQRFEVFKTTMECSKTSARWIVKACCALHNFHLNREGNVAPRRRRQSRQRFFDYYKDETLVHGRYSNEDPERELETLNRLFMNVDLARASEEDSEEEEILDGETNREVLLDHFIEDDSVPWQWSKAHL